MNKIKNYYLGTVIHEKRTYNVGFSLEFDGTEKNPQAKVLAAIKAGVEKETGEPLGYEARFLNIQNLTVVLTTGE